MMLIRWRSGVTAAIMLCALGTMFGCGHDRSNTAAIEGNVQLDGKPLAQGTIRFLPAGGVEGSIASGEIVDGRYRISAEHGPVVGWNRVEINGIRKTGRMVQRPFPQSGATEEVVEAVGPQFNSSSTLKFEVEAGAANRFDIEVNGQSPGAAR